MFSMIHPYIKKFWESRDQSIGSYSFSGLAIWFIISDPEYYNQGGPPPPLKKDIIYMSSKPKPYCMNERWYSEEEMLKIIGLKSFL
jgi:hypothetical protein